MQPLQASACTSKGPPCLLTSERLIKLHKPQTQDSSCSASRASLGHEGQRERPRILQLGCTHEVIVKLHVDRIKAHVIRTRHSWRRCRATEKVEAAPRLEQCPVSRSAWKYWPVHRIRTASVIKAAINNLPAGELKPCCALGPLIDQSSFSVVPERDLGPF